MNVQQFYGFKVNQEQTFSDKGKRLVVTKIKTLPLKVERVKLKEKDGYWALQVVISRDQRKKKKPLLREIKLTQAADFKTGETIKLSSVFKSGEKVQVKGVTKGRGFAGVVKRWGFKGGPRTHGQSDRQRAPGSIGQGTDPGRVWKGKKMPGHMGNKPKTIKGLRVFKVDDKNQELWITGLVPGVKGGLLKISKQ